MRKILYSFVLILFLFPMGVFAQDDSMIYFYDYPNGYRTVSNTGDSSLEEGEVLLYSGKTDSNGKVILRDFDQDGFIRIVQKVPNGYSTTNTEYTINLARENSVEFVNDTAILINPKTYRSLFSIFSFIVIVISLYYMIVHHREDILALSIAFIIFVSTNVVSAEMKDFVINVKDGKGKAMSNVEIEVYGKPNKVYSSYYMVYDANGGVFPNDSDKYYVPIPYAETNIDDFWSSFSYDDFIRNTLNIYLAQNEGYVLIDNIDYSQVVYNGMIVELSWDRISNENSFDMNFNGGSISFLNHQYDHLRMENFYSMLSFLYMSKMSHDDSQFIGFDNNASCSHFNQYGLSDSLNTSFSFPFFFGFDNTDYYGPLYACWHEQPDGIYFDDSILLGNRDSCYVQSRSNLTNDIYYTQSSSYYDDMDNYHYIFSPLVPFLAYSNSNYYEDFTVLKKFDEMKIVDHGEVIFSATSSDFRYDSNEHFYEFTNDSKSQQYSDYMYSVSNVCNSMN